MLIASRWKCAVIGLSLAWLSVSKNFRQMRVETDGFGPMEYAVKAETHEGNTMTLRRGFASHEDAEDHPVVASLWKRVWIEEVPPTPPTPPAALPPMPWTGEIVPAYGGKTGFYFIKDANGRRIMSLLGRVGEREKMTD